MISQPPPVGVRPSFVRRTALAALALGLALPTALAQVPTVTTPEDQSKAGECYPEVVVEITNGTETLRKITTLDTGAQYALLTKKCADLISAVDGTEVSIKLGPLSALDDAFPGNGADGKPKVLKDSQVLEADDVDSDELCDAVTKKLAVAEIFDAIGMAWIDMADKTFVLDPCCKSKQKFKRFKSYEVKFFDKDSEDIPDSTVCVPVTLTEFGNFLTGDDSPRPLASGSAQDGTNDAEATTKILVDSGAIGSRITPDYAEAVTGMTHNVGDVITIDEIEIGTGTDKVVIKNVKFTVSNANKDHRDMLIGQNVLQHFETVWALNDATPKVGFTKKISKGKATTKQDVKAVTKESSGLWVEPVEGASSLQPLSGGPAGYVHQSPAGHLLVGRTNSVQRLSGDGITLSVINSPMLNDPRGIATDGNLVYVATVFDQIMIFDETDTLLGQITNVSLIDIREIAFGPEGDLWAASAINDLVVRMDPTTGAVIDTFSDPALNEPTGLAFTSEGFLFVSGRLSNNVMLLDPLATTPSFAPFVSGLARPAGITVEDAGVKESAPRGVASEYGMAQLWVVEELANRVRGFGAEGDVVGTIPTPGPADDVVIFTRRWPIANMGCALPGVSGEPVFEGSGSMLGGSTLVLALNDAAPSTLAVLFGSITSIPTAFKGGVLKTVPPILEISLVTSPFGQVTIPALIPSGLPGGFELFLQYGIADGAAVAGVSLSNALAISFP